MCVSRPVEWQDYKTFDYILAMDHLNLKTLLQESSSEPGDRIHLFMAFAEDGEARAVPDPYGGGDEGFEVVMDMVEAGCTALLSHIEHQHLGQATSA